MLAGDRTAEIDAQRVRAGGRAEIDAFLAQAVSDCRAEPGGVQVEHRAARPALRELERLQTRDRIVDVAYVVRDARLQAPARRIAGGDRKLAHLDDRVH